MNINVVWLTSTSGDALTVSEIGIVVGCPFSAIGVITMLLVYVPGAKVPADMPTLIEAPDDVVAVKGEPGPVIDRASPNIRGGFK